MTVFAVMVRRLDQQTPDVFGPVVESIASSRARAARSGVRRLGAGATRPGRVASRVRRGDQARERPGMKRMAENIQAAWDQVTARSGEFDNGTMVDEFMDKDSFHLVANDIAKRLSFYDPAQQYSLMCGLLAGMCLEREVAAARAHASRRPS